MSLSSIPPELILTLADILPTASLNNLLRTCQSLHALLAPVLTSRITTENRASSILRSGIAHNHLPTVHLALAHRASWHVKRKGRACYNALKAACDGNQLDIVAALLRHYGAGIIAGPWCHFNPFAMALMDNNISLATVFIQHGIQLDCVWGGSEQAALDIVARFGSAAMAELLIKHGAPVQTATNSLICAVESDRWDVARVLLHRGVPVRDDMWADPTPLTGRSLEMVDTYMQTRLAEAKARSVANAKQAEIDAQEAETERIYAVRKIAMYDSLMAGDWTSWELNHGMGVESLRE